MPPDARAVWDGATRRVFDVGFQSLRHPSSETHAFSVNTHRGRRSRRRDCLHCVFPDKRRRRGDRRITRHLLRRVPTWSVYARCPRARPSRTLQLTSRCVLRQGQKLRSNVELTTRDGVRLRGWRLQRPAGIRTVLFFYGNRSSVVDPAWSLDWLGQALEGYGFSEGKPSLDKSVLDDSLEVHAFAAPRSPGKRGPSFRRAIHGDGGGDSPRGEGRAGERDLARAARLTGGRARGAAGTCWLRHNPSSGFQTLALPAR